MGLTNADWYQHYSNKKVTIIKQNEFIQNVINDIPYVDILQKYIQPGSTILECGCGLARTCMSMTYAGYDVTALDVNQKLLNEAKKNIKRLKMHRLDNNLKFKKLNFMDIKDDFKSNSFDCITHQGVMEHFPLEEITPILDLQLEIATYIIFSIPIESEYNSKYFIDDIYRNLWTAEYWLKKVLKKYNIIDKKIAHQRSDNLIVVIKRK